MWEKIDSRGQVPFWIGNAFKQLRMLSLRINRFNGSIPLAICHLTSLRFLDLSLNSLSREIPKCLKNITTMNQKEISTTDIWFIRDGSGPRGNEFDFELNALLMWKGVEQVFYNAAFFLRSIDLSSNQFIGGIPTEIQI
ncbi:hypothetical protein L6164_005812 [Bauhinia variegata]|uniref:Uncharacterized protein n=1 Tax=Bauhinia variegata TaxID=167791 RepID=A0ACB9PSD9_BAUVA|nr:hypothetical protein L6164_005812 [Bauhinia variegata]